MTDTNQASELFELCKKVYELTSWKDTHSRLDDGNHTIRNEGNEVLLGSKQVPLYTSDYILEKLPREIRNQTIEVVAYGDHWEAAYSEARDALWDTAIKSHAADTPLLALLKLTIALSEAGELDNE